MRNNHKKSLGLGAISIQPNDNLITFFFFFFNCRQFLVSYKVIIVARTKINAIQANHYGHRGVPDVEVDPWG